MSYFDAYKARVSPNRESMQDAVIGTSKRQAINNIMNSPTKSYVRLNDSVDSVPVIASDKETFHMRTYLFLPDTGINVGNYIHQTDNSTYLAVDQKKDEIFPQLIGELCNDTFDFVTDGTRVIVGYDDFKRPIYREVGVQPIKLPCVMTTKIPSVVDNSPIPLPDGATIIKIPYKAGQVPKINYIFKHRDGQFKVTTISYDNVFNEVGYIEIRLQRET